MAKGADRGWVNGYGRSWQNDADTSGGGFRVPNDALMALAVGDDSVRNRYIRLCICTENGRLIRDRHLMYLFCTVYARLHAYVVRGSPRRTTSCLPRWPVTAALLSTPPSTRETDRAQEAAEYP